MARSRRQPKRVIEEPIVVADPIPSQYRKINKSKPLKGNQNYPGPTSKTQIFLHHTAGTTADGAIRWWNQTPEHVGAAYVVDRDGTIYETFPPEKWAYHLGIKGDDNYSEKHGIGIEIVAAGQLIPKNGQYFFYPLLPNPAGGRPIPINEIEILESAWRGYSAYHAYTPAQCISVIWLIDYLVKTHKINLQPDIRGFYEYNEDVIKNHLPGLWAHSTVRKDKKDIYPCTELLSLIYSYMNINL